MDEDVDPTITFVLNGTQHTLSRSGVETRLADVEPDRIHQYSVRVGDSTYPVLQVLALAVARSKKEFNTQTAARHLRALGFVVQPPRRVPGTPDSDSRPAPGPGAAATSGLGNEEWHTEVEVQATVAGVLGATGWVIRSMADTKRKQPGIDIVAERGLERIGIEVKGYPSTRYADSAKAHLVKPTPPATQARQWFAGAVLAAMRLHHKKVRELDGKSVTWRNVIALPDFTTYRALVASTSSSLKALDIEVWWVGEHGSVTTP